MESDPLITVARRAGLAGRYLQSCERNDFGTLPTNPRLEWYFALLESVNLVNAYFFVDVGGIRYDFQWLSPKDTAEETFDLYPGLQLQPRGWVAICSDPTGSGNPVFCRLADGPMSPVVLFYHDGRMDPRGKDDQSGTVITESFLGFLAAITPIRCDSERGLGVPDE